MQQSYVKRLQDSLIRRKQNSSGIMTSTLFQKTGLHVHTNNEAPIIWIKLVSYDAATVFTSKVLQNKTIERFKETLHNCQRVCHHSLEASPSATELLLSVMVRLSWMRSAQKSIPEYHLWVSLSHAVNAVIKLVMPEEKILRLKQNS